MLRIRFGEKVPALAWDGDELLAPENGPVRWMSDGTRSDPPTYRTFGGPFDRSVASADGRYRVLYAERGTKALLLDRGELIRELDRSYYHAEDYDYPVAVGTLADGRDVVIHCPTGYNELQIDDLHTGARLTGGTRDPADVFHSWLSISPDGRHLLVVGWVWHPYGVAMVFPLADALADSTVLDGWGITPFDDAVGAEVAHACWLDADRIVVTTAHDEDGDRDEDDDGHQLGPRRVGVWSLSAGRWLHRSDLAFVAGVTMARGEQVVTLRGHPRLVDPATGRVLAEWPEVASGSWTYCFGVTHVPSPVVALHPDGGRLAVATAARIAVIDLPSAEKNNAEKNSTEKNSTEKNSTEKNSTEKNSTAEGRAGAITTARTAAARGRPEPPG